MHKGSYENGSLATNPFQEKDLICKDIMRVAWDTNQSKRLRSNNHLNTLRGYVQVNDYLWCEIFAVANCRAEEIRSKRHGTQFDQIAASKHFETNPFLWDSFGRGGSQVS